MFSVLYQPNCDCKGLRLLTESAFKKSKSGPTSLPLLLSRVLVLLKASPPTLLNYVVFDSPTKNSVFKVLTLKSAIFLPTAELQFSGREPIFRLVLNFLRKKESRPIFWTNFNLGGTNSISYPPNALI